MLKPGSVASYDQNRVGDATVLIRVRTCQPLECDVCVGGYVSIPPVILSIRHYPSRCIVIMVGRPRPSSFNYCVMHPLRNNKIVF